MADSPAKASSATLQPGIIEPGNKGALKMTPAVLSVEHMLNCQVRAADARHAAAAHGAQHHSTRRLLVIVIITRVTTSGTPSALGVYYDSH